MPAATCHESVTLQSRRFAPATTEYGLSTTSVGDWYEKTLDRRRRARCDRRRHWRRAVPGFPGADDVLRCHGTHCSQLAVCAGSHGGSEDEPRLQSTGSRFALPASRRCGMTERGG